MAIVTLLTKIRIRTEQPRGLSRDWNDATDQIDNEVTTIVMDEFGGDSEVEWDHCLESEDGERKAAEVIIQEGQHAGRTDRIVHPVSGCRCGSARGVVMGVNTYVVVGPYIRVKLPANSEVEEEYKACLNAICPSNARKTGCGPAEVRSNFCPHCGVVAGTSKRTVEKSNVPCLEEMFEDEGVEGEDLWWPDISEDKEHQVFLDNMSSRRRYADRYYLNPGQFNIDLDIKSMIADVEEFRTAFQQHIAVLDKVFGEDNVKVNWGVLHFHAQG